MSLFVRAGLFLLLFMAVTAPRVVAQPTGINFFELDVNLTEDSARYNIVYLLGVSDNSQVANISIALKDGDDQAIHNLSSSIASLKAANAWRLENGILYLTVETGAHAPSLYYEARAVLTPVSGKPLEYVRTKQM